MSEEQQKAKNWDILQQYNDEKARLTRDENELEGLVADWDRFAREFRDKDKRFKFGSDEITVYRRRLVGETKPQQLCVLPTRALDADKLRTLYADLSEARKRVADLGKQLRALGVPIH